MRRTLVLQALLLGGVFLTVSPLWAQKKLLPAVRKVTPPAGSWTSSFPRAVQKGQAAAAVSAAQSLRTADVVSPRLVLPYDEDALSCAFGHHKEEGTLYQNLQRFIKESLKRQSLFRRFASVRTAMEEVPADWGDLPASGYDLQRAVYDSYIDVMELWQKRFGDKINFPFLKTLLMPKLYPTETALKTNRLSLFFSAKVADKADWLRQRPGKGKDELQRQTDRLSIRNFAKRLSAEKMIFLGEIHYVDEIQDHISELIVEIKRQNPSRRIVVFTEFIDLPSAASGPRHTLATYYRRIAETELAPLTLQDGAKVRYAPMSFWWLLKQQVEIYPPEDPTQQALFQKEMLQGEWVSVYTLGERNKIWARVIAHKMAQIRRQNPDALFVVYAGMGHTSWLAPYALPKFFASEQPVVAEVSVGRPSWNSILYPVWGGQDPFFTRTSLVQQLYFWTGQDARLLGKQTGFDYLWVLPKDGR